VVLGGHDGRLQILIPDARCPVPNGQEVLGVEGIPYQAVHWAMVTCQINTDLYTLCKLCNFQVLRWFSPVQHVDWELVLHVLQIVHFQVPRWFSTVQHVDWELCKPCCACMTLHCRGQFCTGIILLWLLFAIQHFVMAVRP